MPKRFGGASPGAQGNNGCTANGHIRLSHGYSGTTGVNRRALASSLHTKFGHFDGRRMTSRAVAEWTSV